MAILDEERFKSLISEYPEYIKFLKKYIHKYKDEKKQFLLKTISKIEFFKGISKEAQHDIIYSLQPMYFEKG